MKQQVGIWEVVWLLIWLREVDLVEKSIAKASQNDNNPKFSKMQKNDSQPETAYVTRDSVVLLILTHFYIGKVIVKQPFREGMLPEITRETA